MTGLPSSDPGADGRDGFQVPEAPITAACFLPSHVPAARAWQRVAVVPAANSGRQRKIWKRVPGLVSGQRDIDYLRAMGELEGQGVESRKRARHERHVAAWGEAGWNASVDEARDGKWDLVQARAAVSLVHESQKSSIPATTRTKPARFPEEPLRRVPRKRHNSRFPIDPLAKTSRMIADMQPLIEFEVPASVEQPSETHHANQEQPGRRSSRRRSRRSSLFPGDLSPKKVSAVTLAPFKMGAPRLSPIKRPAVVPSPTKVAESPLHAFHVSATPVKVVLESPKASVPVTSPTKSSPVSRPDERHFKIPDTPSTPFVTINGALVFDQPCPEVVVEPKYEAQRRRSLQSARRSDRRSSGAGRLIKFDSVAAVPGRRHSFTAATTNTKDAASRRKTLDVFFSLERDSDEVVEPEEEALVVSIDAGADVDIFAHQPAARRMSSTQVDEGPSSLGLAAKPLEPASRAENPDDAVFPPSTPLHVVLASPTKNDGGVADAASPNASSPDQAAMCQSPGTAAETDQRLSSPEPDPHPATVDESSNFTTEVDHEDVGFEYQDPEGLSTIYEETSVMDSDAPLNVSAEATAQLRQGDDISDTETVCSPASPKATSDSENAAHQDGVQGAGSADSRPLANCAAAVDGDAMRTSTNHVATPTDVMFDHDSSEHTQLSTRKSFQARLLETTGDDAGSPASSEGSSVTLDNNVCVASFAAKENVQHDTLGLPAVSPTAHNLSPPTTRMGIIQSTPTKEVVASTCLSPKLGSTTTDVRIESSGFTPINGRQVSPPNQPSSLAADEDEPESEGSDMDNDLDDDVNMDDCEVTEALDEDLTLTVVGPFIENDTLTFSHDDSETEMLRKFVTRVAADRDAKAAAAAAAAKTQRPKRRSGSTGSAASSTGSPIAKAETPHKRKPLGEMNTNSPSPAKKRKHKGDDDEKQGGDAPDSADKPKRKRPRRRGDPVLDAAPEPLGVALASDASAVADPAPRRSTRSRNSRIALKPTAPSANSIALSLLPVRLPGSAGMLDEPTIDTHVNAASRNRSEEKDLAAVTRVNTRKNKSGAIPARLVLARQAEDPSWRMKELKGVFDAKESRAAGETDGRKTRKGKSVRWDAELVRFQGDDKAAPSAFKALATSLLADVLMDGDDGVDELAPTPEAVSKPEPAALPPTPMKKALPRRAPSTRSSKLQAPTPVEKIGAVSALTGPGRGANGTAAAGGIPKPAAAAAPKTATAGMATRRSKIAKLGMGVNGTPAPKRRARMTGI